MISHSEYGRDGKKSPIRMMKVFATPPRGHRMESCTH